jgi:thioredoxin-related protein
MKKKSDCSECKKLRKELKEQNERFQETLERIAKFISFESYIARKSLRAEDVTEDVMEEWELAMKDRLHD